MTIFNEDYKEMRWTLDKINELATSDAKLFINHVENAFKDEFKNTLEHILKRRNECKVILISGPSSSGKTTFANMLSKALGENGIWSSVLSLDNFYQGIKKVPKLEDGTEDFESIEGLDVKEIKKCLSDIIKTGHADIPIYDFSQMAPSKEKIRIDLPTDGVLIMEGLHAISPVLSEGLEQQNLFKIYINVKGGIRNDEGVFFPPKFIRLMRRIQRDHKYRYTSPEQTIIMWKNVSRGEKLYVRPLRKFADIKVNSLHAYEPCVMAKEMIDLMNEVPENLNMSVFTEKLKQFNLIDQDLVPRDSLLREFI